MRGMRLVWVLLLSPALWIPAGVAAMGAKPQRPVSVEATVPGDLERVTLQVDEVF